MTVPTDHYEPLAMIEGQMDRMNSAVAAFAMRDSMKLSTSEFGGAIMGYFVYDDATYDGEPVALFDTPLEAILDWHESEIETVVS